MPTHAIWLTGISDCCSLVVIRCKRLGTIIAHESSMRMKGSAPSRTCHDNGHGPLRLRRPLMGTILWLLFSYYEDHVRRHSSLSVDLSTGLGRASTPFAAQDLLRRLFTLQEKFRKLAQAVTGRLRGREDARTIDLKVLKPGSEAVT